MTTRGRWLLRALAAASEPLGCARPAAAWCPLPVWGLPDPTLVAWLCVLGVLGCVLLAQRQGRRSGVGMGVLQALALGLGGVLAVAVHELFSEPCW